MSKKNKTSRSNGVTSDILQSLTMSTDDGEVVVAQKKKPQFEDVFQWIRSFGWYQRILFVGVNLILVPISLQFMLLLFGTGTPKFHCSSPNSTCPENKCCENCTSYVFDGPFTSAVSEWNLICDRAHIGATLQSCFFAGMLIGSIPGGWVSDTFGRRMCLLANLALMFAFSVGSYFADWPSLLALLRLGVGFFLVPIMLCQYVFAMEIIGPKWRTFCGKFQDTFWDIGDLVCFAMAYLIRDWRMLVLASTLTAIPFLLSWRIFPETPRWLVAHDYLDEAADQLMKYGKKKNKSANREQIKQVLTHIREAEIELKKNNRKYTPLDLFKTPKMRKRTLILCFDWFVISMMHFGFYLFLTTLTGDIYINFLVMGLLTIPNLPISYYLMRVFGRRITFIGYLFVIAVLCLSVLIIPKEEKFALLVISLIGKSFLSCSFNNVYLYTSELYPTVVRNLGISVGSTSARVGAILTPYIVMLSQLPGLSTTLPIVIFGVCGLLAALLSLMLPETIAAPMSQTIEEAENQRDSFSGPCSLRSRPSPVQSRVELTHL